MSDKYLKIRIDSLEMSAIQKEINSLINKKYSNNLLDTVVTKICSESREIIKNHISYGAWAALDDFSENNECLALNIEKIELPVLDKLPKTPINRFDKETELSMRCFDVILLGLMCSAKLIPVANISENEGRLIRNVIAKIGYENETSSHGSIAPLGFHNDQLNYDLSRDKYFSSFPDVLAFLNIKNQEKINTEIISVESILDNLSYKSVRLLQKGAYNFQGPKSTLISPYSPCRTHEALLIKHGDFFTIRFDPNVVGLSLPHEKEYKIALDQLTSFIKVANSDISY
jgi:hypothetical protein